MFINGSGAKPMDAFCSFPKQLPSRAEVLLSFSVVGLCSACAWSIAMPSFPTVRGVRYEAVLFPSMPRYSMGLPKATDMSISSAAGAYVCVMKNDVLDRQVLTLQQCFCSALAR